MERVDLTKKGYMYFGQHWKKKKTSREIDARTDRLSDSITRPGGYPGGLQGTPDGRFCVYFIDVLYAISVRYAPQQKGMMMEEHTWPPGPELREKAMSTDALGILDPLNRNNHSRAAAASFEVARFEREGGVGGDVSRSLRSVLCRVVRTAS
jgi:hypothetical protein